MKTSIKKFFKKDYPEEYSTWEVEFFYRKFFVNKHVLIPRFETESLVREAIKIAKNENIDTLIDVWTGSGIIPISINADIWVKKTYAVDISKTALKVASRNAKKHNIKIDFLKSDLLQVFMKYDNFDFSGNILITANLPYIKAGDWENMSEDTIHEPKKALFWWKITWFETYERLFLMLYDFISNFKPNKIFIVCEIGYDQKEIADKFLQKIGFKNYSFVKDLSWIERFIIIDWKK